MLVLASIVNLFPADLVSPGKSAHATLDFPSPLRSAVAAGLRTMISRTGVAKKRRGQGLAAITVKWGGECCGPTTIVASRSPFIPLLRALSSSGSGVSVHLDVGGLQHRPPFCDLGLLPGAECLRRELVFAWHFQPQLFEF